MISLITLNYNNLKVTLELLESIRPLRKNDIEVIVLDNGSRDNPASIIAAHYPWVNFVRSEVNLGFAGGNNLAMLHAKGDYFFFINNDTEFVADILPRMVTFLADNPGVGILCPLLRYYSSPRKIQYAGFSAISPITGRNKCNTSVGDGEAGGLIYTNYAHGAAMMVPRKVIEEVGVMPENYFVYYEELDWSERIRAAGYQIVVDTTSTILHKESQTVSTINELKSYLMTRNRILFMRKFSKFHHLALFWVYFLLVATPKHIIGYALKSQWQNIRAHMAAIAWNFSFRVSSEVIGYKFNHLGKI